jgi:hypothetical protein
MDLSPILGLNSHFGAVLGRIRAFAALGSLTFAEQLGLSKSTGRRLHVPCWKTALRLCRLGVIVALGELRVCEGGHDWGVMKNRWSTKNSLHAVRTLDDLKRIKGPAQAELGRGTLQSFEG